MCLQRSELVCSFFHRRARLARWATNNYFKLDDGVWSVSEKPKVRTTPNGTNVLSFFADFHSLQILIYSCIMPVHTVQTKWNGKKARRRKSQNSCTFVNLLFPQWSSSRVSHLRPHQKKKLFGMVSRIRMQCFTKYSHFFSRPRLHAWFIWQRVGVSSLVPKCVFAGLTAIINSMR